MTGVNQQGLSIYFSGAWKDPDPPPFGFVTWDGGPRLDGCAAALGFPDIMINTNGNGLARKQPELFGKVVEAGVNDLMFLGDGRDPEEKNGGRKGT